MTLKHYILEQQDTNTFQTIEEKIKEEYPKQFDVSDDPNWYDRLVTNEFVYIFYVLYENEKEQLTRKYSKYPELIEFCREIFPYSGMAYRTMTFDLKMLRNFIDWQLSKEEREKLLEPIDRYRLQTGVKKTEKLKEIHDELFLRYLTNYVENQASEDELSLVSWSKSLNGIKFFKENQFGNHNITIKGHIDNGFDMESFTRFLEYNLEKRGIDDGITKRFSDTYAVEEVLGFPDQFEIEESRILKKKKERPKPSPYDFI